MLAMVLNETQFMIAKDHSIKIRDTTNPLSANPVGVVNIFPSFQVRIGQKFKDLTSAMNRVSTDIFFKPIFNKNGIMMFSVMLLDDGIVRGPLGTLTTYNGIVVSYQFNQNFKMPMQIAAIQTLRFRGDTKTVAKNIAMTLSAMIKVKLSAQNWGIRFDDASVNIYLKSDSMLPEKYRLYYFVSKDANGLYFINTIGYRLSDLIEHNQ